MNEQVNVPKEALKQQREQVFQKVKREKQRKKRIFMMTSTIVAALFLLVCSVRLSPTFAGYISKIPGFAPIVEMIAYDKGMEDIVKNQYFEEIGVMATDNQITVTLVGVIADHSGMVISYEVDAPFDISQLDTKKVEILQGGEPMQASHTFGWFGEESKQHIEEVITLTSSETVNYDTRDFEIVFHFADDQQSVVHLPFTLKNPVKEAKVIEVNQDIVVEGQRLTVEKISISPLRVVVDVMIDQKNTMQVLSLDQLRLVDERGEDWTAILNGISGMGEIRDGRYALHMQSNYFREPKKLTLVIGEIAALPKGEDYIEVDFRKKKVLYQPKLMDWEIEVVGKGISISGEKWGEGGRQLLGNAIDQAGNIYYSNSSSWYSEDGNRFKSNGSYDEVSVLGPIKINLQYYPNIIGEHIEIPVIE